MTAFQDRLRATLADRYAIERELGRGGMATVFLALDLRHNRQVALKVLRPELALVLGAERFLAEIRITARLDHPHILTLIDSGSADGYLYYVLPYVPGDSLRQRLDREGQLGLEDAFAIARQVASALDYAHRQGVIHRDVKPENIMMHEGEAMLADFGIALALQGAGGDRLTETGLSLGTPQYMSPEQATADLHLDGRTDIYSLAVVLYEMLAGETPITGPSPRAIYAKLLTERPTPLSAVRDTVPEGVSSAVAKALARAPADRFKSATEFIAAAEAGLNPVPAPQSRRRRVALLGGAVTILTALVLFVALKVKFDRQHRGLLLGEKVQITNSANVLQPSISPDGRQLAYFSQRCTDSGCHYAVVVQDVGGRSTRTILESATAEYGLDWSPDRRNLLVNCTIEKRWGTYLVSALGGAPRFLGSGVATFFAGGDSLLVGPPVGPDSAFWIRVTSLGGDIRDSIRVVEPGSVIGRVLVIPGTPWIIAEVKQARGGRWDILDRHGVVASHVTSSFNILAGQEADNALWLVVAGANVVRIPIDPTTGRFAARWDTLSGPFTAFSVTADGRTLVTDQGTYDYGVWRLTFADLLAGRLPDAQRIAHASTPIQVEISPDGERLRWIRELPSSAGGGVEKRITVTPYADTTETQIDVSGSLISANWLDSVTLEVGTRRPGHGLHLAEVDARTGAELRGFDLPPDSDIVDFTAVANGWSWIPAAADRIVVQQNGRTRTFPKPRWLWTVGQMIADRRGHLISYLGWGSEREDSLIVGIISLDDGSNTRWASLFAEDAGTAFLPDGSLLAIVFESEQTATMYRLRGPGKIERLGTIPRPVSDVSIAGDLKRALLTVRDYHADAWMARIVRR